MMDTGFTVSSHIKDIYKVCWSHIRHMNTDTKISQSGYFDNSAGISSYKQVDIKHSMHSTGYGAIATFIILSRTT